MWLSQTLLRLRDSAAFPPALSPAQIELLHSRLFAAVPPLDPILSQLQRRFCVALTDINHDEYAWELFTWRSRNSVTNLNCSRGRIYAKGAARWQRGDLRMENKGNNSDYSALIFLR